MRGGAAAGGPVLGPWLNRSMIVVLFVALAFGCSQSMVRPLVAPYATTLGVGPLLAGLAVSLQPLPGFLLAVPVGAVADRFGRRRVLLAGAAILGLGAMVLATVGSFAGLLAGQLILGLGVLGLGVGGQAAATMPVGDATVDVRRVSGFSTALMVGHMVGPTLGGVVTDLGGYRTAFALVIAIAVGIGLISALLPATPRGGPAASGAPGEPRAAAAPFSLLAAYPQARAMARNSGVLAAAVASSIGVALLQIRSAFVPLHLDQAGWSASEIGLALSGAGLAGLVARVVFPLVERRWSTRSLLTTALVAGAGALSVAVLSTSAAAVFVALAASGFALSPTNPLTMVAMSRFVAPGQRGLAVGLRLTLNRFSNWVAPVLIGGLAALAGIQASLVVCSIATAAAGAAVGRRLPGRGS